MKHQLMSFQIAPVRASFSRSMDKSGVLDGLHVKFKIIIITLTCYFRCTCEESEVDVDLSSFNWLQSFRFQLSQVSYVML